MGACLCISPGWSRWPAGLLPQVDAGSYYFSGQLHPLVEIRIELNGHEIDSYRSKRGPLEGLRQTDRFRSSSSPGANELVVHWKVLEGELDKPAPVRAGYRIKLKHQKDPNNTRTAVDMVQIIGLEVPLPEAGTTGSDRLEFQALMAQAR